MKKRLLCLGLLVTISQLLTTGCCHHPIQRWRANHPCGACNSCGGAGSVSQAHPLLHPVQTRRAMMSDGVATGPTVGPVVTNPPCHGCASGTLPGMPVVMNGTPGNPIPVVTTPAGGYPPIGYPLGAPTPITPGGPTVVPSSDLPNMMPPKTGTNP